MWARYAVNAVRTMLKRNGLKHPPPPRILTLAPLFSRIPLMVVPLAPRTGPTCRCAWDRGRVQGGGLDGGAFGTQDRPHLDGQSTGRGQEIQRGTAPLGGSIARLHFALQPGECKEQLRFQGLTHHAGVHIDVARNHIHAGLHFVLRVLLLNDLAHRSNAGLTLKCGKVWDGCGGERGCCS